LLFCGAVGLGAFPWLCSAALVLFLPPEAVLHAVNKMPGQRFLLSYCPLAKGSTHQRSAAAAAGKGHPTSHCRRSPTTVALLAAATAQALVPLRHLVLYPASTRWTDEGALYSWHMKLTERSGWLALLVSEESDTMADGDCDGAPRQSCSAEGVSASTQSSWWLVPETDTALHPDQAGALVHNPGLLLQYVAHLRRLFAQQGHRHISVRPLSCVAVNGRPAQPLFMNIDLVPHIDPYFALANEVRGWSGVGRFVHQWQSAAAAPLCDLSLPHGSRDEEGAVRLQLSSDATYRWLYGPLMTRPTLAEWPWQGRSRLPPQNQTSHAREAAPADWAAKCSFLHSTQALWCPVDASQH